MLKKSNIKKNYTISIRIPEKLYFKLLEKAEQEEMNISELVRYIIVNYLKKK